MKKQILEYILRLTVFIILVGVLHEKISTPLMYGMENIFTILYEKFPFLESSENAQILLSIILGLFSFFMACIGVTYIFAKICGLFKKLDGLKKWQSFLIIILINVVFWIIDGILDKHRAISYSIRASITKTTLTLIPTYLFYLYLNYLTKKFPNPFQKIGYYTSIEFYKDLLIKIKTKF